MHGSVTNIYRSICTSSNQQSSLFKTKNDLDGEVSTFLPAFLFLPKTSKSRKNTWQGYLRLETNTSWANTVDAEVNSLLSEGIHRIVNPKLTQMRAEANTISNTNSKPRLSLSKGRITWAFIQGNHQWATLCIVFHEKLPSESDKLFGLTLIRKMIIKKKNLEFQCYEESWECVWS